MSVVEYVGYTHALGLGQPEMAVSDELYARPIDGNRFTKHSMRSPKIYVLPFSAGA